MAATEDHIVHDIFLLMLNLAQVRDQDQILKLFCRAMASRWPGLEFHYSDMPTADADLCVRVGMGGNDFGSLCISGDLKALPAKEQTLVRNATSLLVILLERLNQERLLERSRKELQAEVEARARELASARERFSDVAANFPGLLYQFQVKEDGTWSFPYVSDGCEALFGVRAEDVVADASRLVDRLAEDYRAQFFQRLELSRRDLSPFNVETQAYGPDGKPFWVQIQSTPRTMDSNSVIWNGVMVDISHRKRVEEALESRVLALTRPLDQAGEIRFHDLFNMDDIQRLQDQFSDATGVSSIITAPDGSPLTRPSNFCRLCRDVIRKTEQGLINCHKSDAVLGRANRNGPVIQHCLSGGLWDAGAAITVGGRHVANWLIGQVRDESQSEEDMRSYAKSIGADEQEYMEAFLEVPTMSMERFTRIADALFTLAGQLSTAAYQNLQQARFIADSKRAEEELVQSEKKWRNILVHTPQIGISLDPKGRLIFANDYFLKLTGWTREEALGLDWYENFLPPELRDRVHEVLDRTMRGRESGLSYSTNENEILTKSGERRNVAWSNVLTRNARGEVEDVTCLGVDLTERQRAEEENRRLAKIIEASDSIAVFKDADLRYLMVNKAYLDLTGHRSVQDLVGKTDAELFNDMATDREIEEYMRNDRKALEMPPGQVLTVEETLRGEDGQERTFLTKKFPVFTKDSERLLGVATMTSEITERKRMETDLILAKEAAEAANRAKSEFLANMSHEIRTPINGIMGMLQLLTTSDLGEEEQEYAQVGIKACKRLTRLLGDILDLSRVEAGRLEISPEPFAMAEIVESLEQLFGPPALQKGLKLELFVAPDVPATLLGDQARLRQILNNLLGNAVKFTSEGSVRLEVSRLPHPGTVRLLFTVSDTGIGMPDDRLGSMFESFAQGEAEYARKYQGAGLGLAITKRLVRLMNGTLSVDSLVGRGTTIHLCLPFGTAGDEDQDQGKNGGTEAMPKESLNILLAEDEFVNRLAATKMLEKMGHTVRQAVNGKQAVEMLAEAPADVVFMDIQMPGMDGMAATQAIREGQAGADRTTVPIVALTAYTMENDLENFLNAGMDACLAKPLERENLERIIRELFPS